MAKSEMGSLRRVSHKRAGAGARAKSASAATLPARAGRVGAPFAACAFQTARDLGADMVALAAESGIDARALADPEGTVGVHAYLRFLDAAARRLKDPLFGLKVGLRSRVTDQRAYALVLMACRDVRSVIEQVSRYESLTHDLFRTHLIVEGDVARLRVVSPWFDAPGGRQIIYTAAAGIRSHSRWLIGSDLPAFEFVSALAAPDGPPGEYERVLGAPTRWGAEHNEVTFPAFILDIPVPSADPASFPALKRAADARLAARNALEEASVVFDARQKIAALLAQGDVSLPRIAAALDLSPRTLQRRLAEADATFSDIVDDARKEEARRYLADETLSLTEVAFLLGFGEQSAFNHAFRRWFGASPGAWRARR